LARRLEAELPDYDVSRRIRRGDASGRIRVVFEVARSERSRWLRFTPSRSKVVYHEDQGWSGVIDVPIGGRRSSQVNVGFVLGNDDDLIEEYSGYRLRFENRSAGTERLGVGLELSRFSQDWRDATLAALEATPDRPHAYRTRITVEPKVTFAITPRLRVSAGVSTSELKPLAIESVSQHANAFVTSIGYDHSWGRGRDTTDAGSSSTRRRFDRIRDGEQTVRATYELRAGTEELDSGLNYRATYELRAGTEELDSDLNYRRHVGQARFQANRRDTSFIADFRAGRITGRAPLFERFTLGDSTTLRGWNKFDLAPAGADRMWHQSVEFQHHLFSYFFDAGSLWNAGGERRIRLATGVGFGVLSVAFPLNADDSDATFILNVRFGVGF
jgi:outer membrane protein assembly factor BamA